MQPPRRRLTTAAVLIVFLTAPSSAVAYSVLAHEAMIDAVWDDQLAPMLKQRFPDTSDEVLSKARAYSYGGALIQDLGYYPFGSHFFSNLVHCVRTGDFVEALIRDSQSVNEYAFALGALAHHASDTFGHSIAVNRAVPIIYPKLRAKYGDEVLFADSPSRHVMTEFAFDVLEVARGAFKSDAYQNLIGFQVALPVLERAFRDTYGLELREVFGNTELAIGTYRYAVSKVIPDMTRLAWREKRDEILAATPDATERDIVYTLTRSEYETAFGTMYRKPSLLARFVVLIFKVVPKVGPLKPLAFRPLTPETERMFRESFVAAHEQYRATLATTKTAQLELNDVDLDTGRRPARGSHALADEAYVDLLERLAKRNFTSVPPALHRNINEYYASTNLPLNASKKTRKLEQKAARYLSLLNASVQVQ